MKTSSNLWNFLYEEVLVSYMLMSIQEIIRHPSFSQFTGSVLISMPVALAAYSDDYYQAGDDMILAEEDMNPVVEAVAEEVVAVVEQVAHVNEVVVVYDDLHLALLPHARREHSQKDEVEGNPFVGRDVVLEEEAEDRNVLFPSKQGELTAVSFAAGLDFSFLDLLEGS